MIRRITELVKHSWGRTFPAGLFRASRSVVDFCRPRSALDWIQARNSDGHLACKLLFNWQLRDSVGPSSVGGLVAASLHG